MTSIWETGILLDAPYSVRPETHWLYELEHDTRQVEVAEHLVDAAPDTTPDATTDLVPDTALDRSYRSRDPLWFSLRLSLKMARELHYAFATSSKDGFFCNLIAGGSRMAPESHAALGFAVKLGGDKTKTVGADILVPPIAFAALKELETCPEIVIADAGLAINEWPEGTPALDGANKDVKWLGNEPKSRAGPSRPGDPVIVAIIDDGIGIANERFRKGEKQTRIEYFLDLSLSHPKGNELLARSWTRTDIDHLLEKYADDEVQFYRALGLIDPRRRDRQPLRGAISHGTHVLDTAAGFDWRKAKMGREQAGPSSETGSTGLVDCPIIVVQLPKQVAENRSDAWMPQSLKRALDWILIKADQLSADRTGQSRRLPLIVNCSFASMAGPQNGKSDVERRITQFVETYRGGTDHKGLCTVVMSAGNSRELRAAARLSLGPTQPCCELPWRVLPDDKTPSFVQIWLPEARQKREQQVAVSLVPPRDAPPEKWSIIDHALDLKMGKHVYARLFHQGFWTAEKAWQECITIAIRATADDDDLRPIAPAGLWQIKIKAQNDVRTKEAIDVDVRVHRDDAGMFVRRKGRQSYFDDPDYEKSDPVCFRARHGQQIKLGEPRRRSPVTRDGTLNAYGFGEGTLLVAGYRRSDGKPASYSAAAAKLPRVRTLPVVPSEKGKVPEPRPDPPKHRMIAAVSEENLNLRGILAAGTYSGSVAIMNGTSVAAPLATRALVEVIVAEGASEDPIDNLYAELLGKGENSLRFGKGRLPFKTSYKQRTDNF